MQTSRINGENWHDKRKRSTLMRRYQTETMASRFAVPTGTVVQCAQGQPKCGGKDVFVHIRQWRQRAQCGAGSRI